MEIVLLATLAVCLLSGGLAMEGQTRVSDKVVRLHVLANSDSEEDQALKLTVRDALLDKVSALLDKKNGEKAE